LSTINIYLNINEIRQTVLLCCNNDGAVSKWA